MGQFPVVCFMVNLVEAQLGPKLSFLHVGLNLRCFVRIFTTVVIRETGL